MGENKSVTRLTYLPRQDSSKNGDIVGYKVLYSESDTDEDFKEIESGTWASDKTLKVVDFDLVNARRIRLVATSTLGDQKNTFISAAEINLYCTDYSVLQSKADDAQKIYNDGADKYTQDSLNVLKTAIDEANIVLKDTKATQETIDRAEIALVKAIDSLTVEKVHLMGDVDGDNDVDVDDVILIQKYLVNLTDDILLDYADLNNDQIVNITDATIVQLVISNIYSLNQDGSINFGK